MPSFRKLSPTEAAALDHRPVGARTAIAQAYDAYVTDFAVGDYGRAELLDGEQRALVRRRLQVAAGRRGLVLRFRLGPGPLIFQVTAAPALSPPPPQEPRAITPVVPANVQRRPPQLRKRHANARVQRSVIVTCCRAGCAMDSKQAG